MATKIEKLQEWRRYYRQQTGEKEIDHNKVADFMIKKGYRPPRPKTPAELLAKDLSAAARAEERVDKQTGERYRANLSYAIFQGDDQMHLWVDTDEASRLQMHKATTKYRDQMVGEAFRLVMTVEHWNRINPSEEPLQVELDLQPDVDWIKNAKIEDEKAS